MVVARAEVRWECPTRYVSSENRKDGESLESQEGGLEVRICWDFEQFLVWSWERKAPSNFRLTPPRSVST